MATKPPSLHAEFDGEETPPTSGTAMAEKELEAAAAREATIDYLNATKDELKQWLHPFTGSRPPYPTNTPYSQTLLTHPTFTTWTTPLPRALSASRLHPTLNPPCPSSILRLIYPETRSPSYLCPPARLAEVHLHAQERAVSGPDPDNWPWAVKVLTAAVYCSRVRFGLGPEMGEGERKVSCYEVARTMVANEFLGAGELEGRVRRVEVLKGFYDERPEGEEVIGDERVGRVLGTALRLLGEDGWRVNIIIDQLEECEGYEWLVQILANAVERDDGEMAGTFRILFTGSKETVMSEKLARWPVLMVNPDGEIQEDE